MSKIKKVKKTAHLLRKKKVTARKSKKTFSLKRFFGIFVVAVLIAVVFYYRFSHPNSSNHSVAGINANPIPFYFGTVVHPENYYLTPNNIYGSTPRTIEDFTRWNSATKNAKLTMQRGSMRFENIAVSSDEASWDWAAEDKYMQGLKTNGIEPFVTLHGNPTWLASPLTSTVTQTQKDQFILEYGKFAERFAIRYKDQVAYYEIWNEPTLLQFWNWTKVDFARLLAEAAYKIKLVDPTAVVSFDTHALDHMINPSLPYGSQGTFMVQVLGMTVPRSNGTSIQVIDAVDMLAPHSYPDRTSDIPEDLLGGRFQMSYFYEYMDGYLKWKYGSTRGKKMYMQSETGWSARTTNLTSGRWVSEEKQGALLVRTALNLMSTPLIEGFIQYDLQDDGINNNDYEHKYGLTQFSPNNQGNLVAKASLTAFSTLITTLDHTNFVSKTVTPINSDKKLYNYYFASPTGDKKVWALTLANALTPLGAINTTTVQLATIQTTAPTVTLVRLDGSTQQLSAPGNLLTITVNENPVFIVDTSTNSLILTPTPTSPSEFTIATPTPQSTNSNGSITPTSTPTATPTSIALPTSTPTQSSGGFITITSPANGTKLTGGISVSAVPTTPYTNNVQKIKIYIDNVLKKDCNYATNVCSYYWTPTVGIHSIYATGYDKASTPNFSTSSTITVTR